MVTLGSCCSWSKRLILLGGSIVVFYDSRTSTTAQRDSCHSEPKSKERLHPTDFILMKWPLKWCGESIPPSWKGGANKCRLSIKTAWRQRPEWSECTGGVRLWRNPVGREIQPFTLQMRREAVLARRKEKKISAIGVALCGIIVTSFVWEE